MLGDFGLFSVWPYGLTNIIIKKSRLEQKTPQGFEKQVRKKEKMPVCFAVICDSIASQVRHYLLNDV